MNPFPVVCMFGGVEVGFLTFETHTHTHFFAILVHLKVGLKLRISQKVLIFALHFCFLFCLFALAQFGRSFNRLLTATIAEWISWQTKIQRFWYAWMILHVHPSKYGVCETLNFHEFSHQHALHRHLGKTKKTQISRVIDLALNQSQAMETNK